MRITIAGAGKVGTHLAKYLSSESQDIYVIDAERDNLSALDLDFNLMTVEGNPTDFSVLRRGRADSADMFIAVTPVTSDNLVACSMAKSMGARLTVARVDRSDYFEDRNRIVLEGMGVDRVIFPEMLASLVILDALRHPWTRVWHQFPDADIVMLAVRIGNGAPVAGKRLRDLADMSGLMHVSAVRRHPDHKGWNDRKTFRTVNTVIPRGDTLVEEGDVLYVTTLKKGIPKVMELCGKHSSGIRKVLVSGSGKLARTLVTLGKDDFSYTIIEPDPDMCRELTRRCPHCRIINGDTADDSALAEAGLLSANAFLALSDSDESNIVCSLTAIEAGVGKQIAEIERLELISRAEMLGIDTIINKQTITTNAIFQLMLDADASTSRCLPLDDAEVGRLTVSAGSVLTQGAVKDLDLPPELTLAGLIRNGNGALVTGSTRLLPGDNVIVFCLGGALHKVEKLFGR